MALSSTAIVEVRNGGSDTLNGGLFNPGATLNSNLAATSATGNSPVVTSATYNFVAGDVGHWLFVKSGTNWTPGWYQIASVAANAATLTATIGTAILYSATALSGTGFNTAAGCATTGSPTGGSWAIDYSQKDAFGFSLVGLTTGAANAIILTASATVAMVGNGVQVTGGTNFIVGFYQINSVSAGVSLTVDRNCTTAAGAGGTAGIGGGLASPGQAGAIATVAGMIVFVNYNATAFSATSASTNIAAGCVSGAGNVFYHGYDTGRFLWNTDANRPTFKIAASTATLFANNTAYIVARLILDGDNQTTSKGSGTGPSFWGCHAKNFNAGAFLNTLGYCVYCSATTCSTVSPFSGSIICEWCEAYANTVTPFTAVVILNNCLSYANTGATTDGYSLNGSVATNCVSYNNGQHGFRTGGGTKVNLLSNCIAEANAGVGFDPLNSTIFILKTCASYNNTGGRIVAGTIAAIDSGPIIGTGTFFTSAATGDFSLNNTASQGALCRAVAFPTTFPAGLTASYEDVGAAQSQASAGSGGITTPTNIFGAGGVLVG